LRQVLAHFFLVILACRLFSAFRRNRL